MKVTTRVALGLFAAWALHDVEEVLTGAANSKVLVQRLPGWLPIPGDIRRDGLAQPQLNTALALMGVFMAASAGSGVRSEGRSWLFQTVLQGFGWHGFGHLAATAALRHYTFGAGTAPVLVIPYWLWARRELKRAGVAIRPTDPRTMALIPPLIIGAHALARAIDPIHPIADRPPVLGT